MTAWKELEPPDAHRVLEETPGAVYVDVRSEVEHAAGHPEGAWNIPLLHRTDAGMQPNDEFVHVAGRVLPRDALLVVGCAVGPRSRKACGLLREMGFTRLVNVDGGFEGKRHPLTGEVLVPGWRDAGLPTATEPTPDGTWPELRRKAGL